MMSTALMLALCPAAQAASKKQREGYWRFADAREREVDRFYDPKAGLYQTGSNQVHISMSMLYLHSLAAIAGHQGPARKDERVEQLTRRLISWPAYIEDDSDSSGDQAHAPGFTLGIDSPGEQHVSFDTQAAAGLSAAYRSGLLPEELRQEVAQTIDAVAHEPIFKAPSVQLNQVNWPISVWRSQAQVTGSWAEAQAQIREYLRIWTRGMKKPMPGSRVPNLSRGLGLRYSPQLGMRGSNLTSTSEYANIIYSGFQGYEEMLSQGMPPLKASDEKALRRWARRLLMGDWTHSGWPNWDTAHGFSRWHLWRYWAWSAESLATIASSRRLADPQEKAAASWLLSKVFERYELLQEQGLLTGSTRFDLVTDFGQPADDLLTGARLAALAARAASSPTGRPREPKGWFWYDPEMKRLTVSSPAYSAALMAPIKTPAYGGLEPARLLDSQGRVLTSLGADEYQAGFTPGLGRSSQQQQRDSTLAWRVTGEHSGNLGQVAITGRTRGRQKVEVSHIFSAESIESSYRIKGAKEGILLIPLWGDPEKMELSPDSSSFEFENSEGGKLRIEMSSPGVISAETRKLLYAPASPRTLHQLQINLSGSSQLDVRLYPLS